MFANGSVVCSEKHSGVSVVNGYIVSELTVPVGRTGAYVVEFLYTMFSAG